MATRPNSPSASPQREDFWERVESVFHAAAATQPAERAGAIDRLCGGDAEVRAAVVRLLDSDLARGDGFLASPSDGLLQPFVDGLLETGCAVGVASESKFWIGRRVQDFTIRKLLGTGGMGDVFEAEQDAPRRAVALKLLHGARPAPERLRRFIAEAEILGGIQHPNIAQVYAAGAGSEPGDGRAFIAMELIGAARPITAFAAERGLSLQARIELFLSVCDAVQFVHQRGVIHRDLKPANVLVDGGGRPKIIDFGLARLAAVNTVAFTQTYTHHVAGTLPYMSPEQLGQERNAVDTRSDVYALGVMLFELLAGRLPHNVSALGLGPAVAVLEREEAPLLSTVNPATRGDLTTVVATALRKDQELRYQSAGELAADLRRWLRNEPIAARPATLGYQLYKLAARHRMVALAAGIALAGILAGGGAAFWQMARADRERDRALAQADRAAQISDFLQRVLAQADPRLGGPQTTIHSALERATEDISTLRAADPVTFADVSALIGSIYHRIGDSDAATRHLRAALAERTRLFGRDSPEVGRTLWPLGFALECEPTGEQGVHFERALQIFQRAYGERHIDTARAWSYLGSYYAAKGRFAEAETPLRRAFDAFEALQFEDAAERAHLLKHLAMTMHGLNRTAEAEPLFDQALQLYRNELGAQHPELAIALRNYGRFLHATRRADEAAAVVAEADRIDARIREVHDLDE